MTSPVHRPDHGKPDDDRDPGGDRYPVQRDLTRPDDDRERVAASQDPSGVLPQASLTELASVLARAYLRLRAAPQASSLPSPNRSNRT